jgi:hypothetical protein
MSRSRWLTSHLSPPIFLEFLNPECSVAPASRGPANNASLDMAPTMRRVHDRILRSRGQGEAVVASGVLVEPAFPEGVEASAGVDAP